MLSTYEPSESLIGIPYVKFESPCKVEFDFELYEDDAFEIKGKVKYVLVGQCSRCLKDAREVVECELDALFEPRKDAEDYSYFGGKIDLTAAVEDAIMGSMPYLLACKDGCDSLRYSDEP